MQWHPTPPDAFEVFEARQSVQGGQLVLTMQRLEATAAWQGWAQVFHRLTPVPVCTVPLGGLGRGHHEEAQRRLETAARVWARGRRATS
ncbi:MAG: hypothetical protein KC620_10085 [Myxococcales bacterium]|nr:hypothetical protein [Myxococcales bacterium]